MKKPFNRPAISALQKVRGTLQSRCSGRGRCSARQPVASHVAARDHEVDDAALELLQHAAEPLVVLKIGIHYPDVGRARSEHALDASPPDP